MFKDFFCYISRFEFRFLSIFSKLRGCRHIDRTIQKLWFIFFFFLFFEIFEQKKLSCFRQQTWAEIDLVFQQSSRKKDLSFFLSLKPFKKSWKTSPVLMFAPRFSDGVGAWNYWLMRCKNCFDRKIVCTTKSSDECKEEVFWSAAWP